MTTDVVVVGAGAAGLAAALTLAERSLRVVLVDGRDRIGGRVRWESVGSSDVPAELGAEFIHGDAPETTGFMREADLRSVPTGESSWERAADGTLRPANDDFTSVGLFERVRDLDADESVEAFLRRFDADPDLRDEARRARAFVEGFEAADPAIASARSIADELGSGVDDASARPVGGYAPLFAHVAERCTRAGVDLRLRTTVECIAWQRGAVSLDVRGTAGVETIRARAAVITVPVGVLQQRPPAVPLAFVPPLPEARQTAIHAIAMGHAVRVTLAFRTPFWETIADGRYRDAAFFHCDGDPFGAFWTQLPLRERTIVAWAGGPHATALAGMTEAQRVRGALDAFGALLGESERAARDFEAGVTHDWAADPFACGAYSYVVTGGGDARAALGAPVAETLFFAGEATATDGQGGTVSGAFATGRRAANETLHALERDERAAS